MMHLIISFIVDHYVLTFKSTSERNQDGTFGIPAQANIFNQELTRAQVRSVGHGVASQSFTSHDITTNEAMKSSLDNYIKKQSLGEQHDVRLKKLYEGELVVATRQVARIWTRNYSEKQTFYNDKI